MSRKVLADQRGAVYVEFLVTFFPILLFFLLLVQLSLGFAARLVVQHAANQAARAAVVVYSDDTLDPTYYGGEAHDEVDELLVAFDESPIIMGSSDDPRLRAVRAAASIPLLGVSPPFDNVSLDDRAVDRALGATTGSRLAGSARYTRHAVSVSFPSGAPGPGSREVTVRVTYLFYCAIPMGDYFLCDGAEEIAATEVDASAGGWAGLLGAGRFAAMSAEATLPYQGYPVGYLYEHGAP